MRKLSERKILSFLREQESLNERNRDITFKGDEKCEWYHSGKASAYLEMVEFFHSDRCEED